MKLINTTKEHNYPHCKSGDIDYTTNEYMLNETLKENWVCYDRGGTFEKTYKLKYIKTQHND